MSMTGQSSMGATNHARFDTPHLHSIHEEGNGDGFAQFQIALSPLNTIPTHPTPCIISPEHHPRPLHYLPWTQAPTPQSSHLPPHSPVMNDWYMYKYDLTQNIRNNGIYIAMITRFELWEKEITKRMQVSTSPFWRCCEIEFDLRWPSCKVCQSFIK